jgi:glycosyltransferase involved in cell wall biosynthesis
LTKILKICVFEPYPFGTMDGNMKTLDYILRFSDKERIQYQILTTKENAFKKRIDSMGIKCDVLNPEGSLASHGGQILSTSSIGMVKTIIAIIKYNVLVYKYFKRNKIDLLYCNSVRSILTVGLAAKLSGIKIVLYVKGELANPLLDFASFILANKIIFFSKSNSEDKYWFLQKIYKLKIEIIEIGLDLTEINSILIQDKGLLNKEYQFPKDIIKICFCGRLSRAKGLDILIGAMREIKKYDAKLYVLGEAIIDDDKQYKDYILNLINEYDLRDQVIFLGWRVDHHEIICLMDIIVNPSFSEGFGRNILESMALKKATIATKTGGLRDTILNGENGFLVPIKNEEAIAEKLKFLIQNSEVREHIAENARKTVVENYRIEDKINKLNELFYRL